MILKSLGLDTALPQPRQGGALVAVGNSFLYLGGGGMGPSTNWPGMEQCWQLPVDGSGRFGINPWKPIAPIPTPVVLVTAALVAGKCYLVGGWGGDMEGEGYTSQVQCYDPASDRWSVPSSAPGSPLAPIACAALGDKIYVVCCSTLPGGTDPPPIFQVYDPAANSWTAGPSLPAPTYGCQCVAVGNSIYVVGGSRGVDFFAYDTVTQTVAAMPRFPGIDAGIALSAAVAYREYVLLLGGIQGMWDPANRSWCFNTKTGVWTELAPLARPRGRASAAVLGGGDELSLVYLAGGVPSDVNNPPFDTVEAIGVAPGGAS